MATSINTTSTRRFGYRYGNPVAECGGAQLRAQCRQLATVVTISGDIDATNLERVGDYAKRFVIAEKPVVLDLGAVHTFPAEAFSILSAVDEACRAAGVDWCLVAGDAVDEVLRSRGGHFAYAVADSVPEALNYFLDGLLARRRLLPLLNQTA